MDKNVLKKFAIESRQELMDKISNKIKKFYVDEEFQVNQNGEVCVLSNEKHTLSLTKTEYENRQLLIKRINEITLEQVIEEAAYTWFNRIIAIRYMEIHDYLPLTKDNQSLGIRVLSSKDNTPDPEIMKISNLINSELDIEFNKDYYSTIQDNNKRFEYILLLICKKLGKVIPQVFDGITDYIDILIPDNLLNDSGYVTKLLKDVSEDNYDQVEIIGWLYQFYNTDIFNAIYDGDMTKKKIEANLLPAATQLFTPEWVVNYMIENSLGKYWIEHSENGEKLIDTWKFFVSEIPQKTNVMDVKSIKFLDPSSGSGHMLIYAFEMFYKMYEQMGYNKSFIPYEILKNNIYGLDIDDRAGQLTILSIILKAREYDKFIFNNDIIKNLNVLSIQNYKLNENEETLLFKAISDDEKEECKEILLYLKNMFQEAKEYGSILKIKKYDYIKFLNYLNKLDELELDIIEQALLKELKNKLPSIIKEAEILSQKYNIVVTNPPYLSFGRMNEKLSSYIKKNYTISKTDLASVFIDKILNEFTMENGYVSLVTTKSWMYLQSFQEIREKIVDLKQFDTIVDFGTELFDGKIGHLPIVAWVNKNYKPTYNLKAIKLSDFCYSRRDEKQTEIFNKNNYYYINQQAFECIDGSPIAYWITDEIQSVFKENKVGDFFQAKQGMTTGNNNMFLRFWYEVDYKNIGFNIENREEASKSKKRWFPYNKGGDYRKWYGNRDYVVNWYNDGKEMKEYTSKLPQGTAVRLKSQDYYFKESITWSFIGSRFATRYSPIGSIFDVGGSSIFPEYDKRYLLAFFNTNIADNLLKIINPTMNYQIKDVRLLPYIKDDKYIQEITELAEKCIDISKEDWDSFETSSDFKVHPFIKYKELKLLSKITSEVELEWKKRFNTLKEYETKLNLIFSNIYKLNNAFDLSINDKDISISLFNKERETKSFISYFIGYIFGRYNISNPDIIINDEINLEQHMIDKDNIVPIIDSQYFNDDIIIKFKEFISYIFGKETLYENLEFIAETLGKKNNESNEETIRRYFTNDFYNDHLKTYQKRPIYWLFDSGKKNGFKCLIYMHRYNKGTVSKIRLDYLHKIQNTYEIELNVINQKMVENISLQEKKELTKKQAEINAKLQETKEYDEKIAHIADQTIEIDLDDGVAINYSKFSVKNPKTGKEESILANSKDIAIKNKKEE